MSARQNEQLDDDFDHEDEWEPTCDVCGDEGHYSFLCPHTTRFDDLDCLKCGAMFFLKDGSCATCGFKQY